MILMQLNKITKHFGAEEILHNINLEIKSQDRIAIVGRNGAGKSTLLKIMADELDYTTGDLFKPKDLTVGYLEQQPTITTSQTIWREMLDVFQHLMIKEKELRDIEAKLQYISEQSGAEQVHILETYDRLQQTFEQEGGYQYETEIKTVLTGLDFPSRMHNTPIHTLSGGQKTRLSLGKLLLQKPDLLILDEPTNHLDIDTMSWLEDYLATYPGAIVIVSHDRYFLDKTVSTVYEISRHHSKKYIGSYSKYLEQRQKDYERELKAYEHQQQEIEKMEDFIQRNLVRASTTKRAQSRRKQLEKMDRLSRPQGEESSAQFSFQIQKKSGHDVLKVHDLAFGYDPDHLLFKRVNLHINRGERIALIGPNGIGKSTFLKILLGHITQSSGHIQLGTNVQIGYYDQEQATLTTSNTVLQELWDNYPEVNEKDIRTVLGNFLFSGDDVLKPIHTLSGGEKARLALAKLMMQKANLLILDEPTNHLDIDSKEVLEVALSNFPGSIIFVSHDRYFINKITDQVVDMQSDGVTLYLGDYDYFIEKKQEQAERKQLTENHIETKENKKEKTLSFHEEKAIQREQRKKQRQIIQLENQITELEIELEHVEEKMTQPDVFQDHEKSLELSTEAKHIKDEMEQLMNTWEELHND